MLLFIVESFNGDNRTIDMAPDWSEFSYSWTCVIIFVLNFAVVAIRNLKIFVKINSFGVIFIMIVVLVICGIGCYSLGDTDYVFS